MIQEKLTRLVTSSTLLMIICVTSSCTNDECSGQTTPRSEITSMSWQYWRTDEPRFENSTSNKILQSDTHWENFSLILSTQIRYFSKLETPAFSIFPRAYACSFPAFPNPPERIKSIEITSNTKFDDTHDVSDDLSDIFEIRERTFDALPWYSIDEYAKNETQYLNNLELRLKSPPSNSGIYSFKVTTTLENGTLGVQEQGLGKVTISR